MYVMGRDPNLFPDPEKFDPERWLKGSKVLDKYYNDVPFGFGPRMCIGLLIAFLNIKTKNGLNVQDAFNVYQIMGPHPLWLKLIYTVQVSFTYRASKRQIHINYIQKQKAK